MFWFDPEKYVELYKAVKKQDTLGLCGMFALSLMFKVSLVLEKWKD